MKSVVILATLAGLAIAAPQGVTSQLSPTASAPAGCSTDHPAPFNLGTDAAIQKRDTTLSVTLKGSVLTDDTGRIGGIVANGQFQFDGPSQAGTKYNAGFSVCSNGSLALGGSTVFYQCVSGNFSNLYYGDISQASNCTVTHLTVSSPDSQAPVQTMSDGQVNAASTTRTPVCQITDGQLQIQQIPCPTPMALVSEKSDGQPIVPTTTPALVSQKSDGQPIVSSSVPTPAVAVNTPAKNATVTTAPVAPKASQTILTGSAAGMTVNTEVFALVAGLVALFAL